jgi:DNA processing protein
MRMGMDTAQIARRMAPLRPPDGADEPDYADAFARAAWSMLGEPGDRTAGLIVTALGAENALDALIARADPHSLARRIDPGDTVDPARLAAELGAGLGRWLPRLRSSTLIELLDRAARCDAILLTPDDAVWPEGVDDLGVHAPLALWVRGNLDAVRATTRSIAIVGARANTEYGQGVAIDLAAELSGRGLAIVSGAAYGIDGIAHRACLKAGGTTIAFLAGGVDRFYPAGHDLMLAQIVKTGAVIAESPCGTQPARFRFLQRNRLIAASASATVVVEAGRQSGSLNTAAHAASIGRPVGAVPGPVGSLASVGCHRLLREDGAVCVTNAAEVIELIDGPIDDDSRGRADDRPSEHTRVIDALSARVARPIEDIARRTGMSAVAVMAALGGLSVEGTVREDASLDGDGGWMLSTGAPKR